jgi:cell division protein FtsB
MAKILRFRRGGKAGPSQRGLFEPGKPVPSPDLTLRPDGRASDARPLGPGSSDAVAADEFERPGDPSPEAARRRRRRRNAYVAALCVVFVTGVLTSIFGERGWIDVRRQRAQLAALEGDFEAQQVRVSALRAEVERLKRDPRAIERIAREKLGYAKPGEIVVVTRGGTGAGLDASGRSAIVPRASNEP